MAFDELYRAHFAFVSRSLRRLGVPECDRGDAIQEVFLVVHRKLPEFRGRAKLTTWLFRIAMGAARDRRRKAHVRREVLDGDEVDRADEHASQEEALERRRDIEMVDRALASLSWDQRTVFVLFELEGFTSGEIAETLSIPVGTVHSRLRLGRGIFQRTVRAEVARREHDMRPVRETSS
jgi:RNA polymerase sigma-70 factor (ECF subfamily)